MEIRRFKPENRIIIVDAEDFDRIYSISILKEEEVEKLANEKFLRHVKEDGIKIVLKINNVQNVFRYNVVSEINYNERGCGVSILDSVKYAIVDDITKHVNNNFEHYRSDCKEFVDHE